jgi:hypothetical protein
VHQASRRHEPHGQSALAGRQTKSQGDMRLAGAGRSRDILPGITTLKGEFSILFIRDAVNR